MYSTAQLYTNVDLIQARRIEKYEVAIPFGGECQRNSKPCGKLRLL